MDVEKRGWLLAGLALLLGLAGLSAGVLYGILFAGMSYQDPTPELAARYEFHSWISQIICCAGAMMEKSILPWRVFCLPGGSFGGAEAEPDERWFSASYSKYPTLNSFRRIWERRSSGRWKINNFHIVNAPGVKGTNFLLVLYPFCFVNMGG